MRISPSELCRYISRPDLCADEAESAAAACQQDPHLRPQGGEALHVEHVNITHSKTFCSVSSFLLRIRQTKLAKAG